MFFSVQPPALLGYASKLAQLACEKREGRLRIAPLSVTSNSELLTPEDRAAISGAFGVPVIDQFVSTEGLIGLSEPGQTVLTFANDLCIAECVDDGNNPVPNGTASAKVLVTNLHNLTQPLIRYELTDRFVPVGVSQGGCLRASVEGRSDEVFRYGVTDHPHVIRTILVASAGIREYQVRQTERGLDMSAVAEGEVDHAAVAAALEGRLCHAGVGEPQVTIQLVDAIPATPRRGKSGASSRCPFIMDAVSGAASAVASDSNLLRIPSPKSERVRRTWISTTSLLTSSSSMSKSGRSISVRAGRLEFVKINAAKFNLRDSYHFILTLTWLRFAALVLAVYVLINLIFASLYWLRGGCIAELPPGSFSEAFFFSVETLATVGYGHMYPDTFYGHCVTTVEIVVGMFGMAAITGLIFVRFSRPTARILFSKCAVISPFDGIPTLMLRVANQRHVAMAEAEFRVMLFRDEPTREEASVRRFYPLKLQFDRMIAFPVALTLRHVIDESSPLYGMTAEDLKKSDTRLMASIVCIDTVIPAPVQSATDYSYDDILWNRRFVEIYTETNDGRLTVDYGRIHDTEEAETQV